MKHIAVLQLLICSILFSKAQGPNTTIISVPIDGAGHTYQAILTLPDDYSSTTKSYPFVLFAHGNGEAGTDISVIYNNQSNAGGPAKFVYHNQWPTSFVNPADGAPYKFIVLSPQQPDPAGGSLAWSSIDYIIDYMIAHYRVDISRLYMTGLSGGGQTGYVYVSECCGISNRHALAAMAIMSQGGGKPNQAGVNATISKGINVWGFGSESDALGINTHLWISGDYGGQSCSCGGLGTLGRWTAYVGGHCCWDQFYDPTYRETVNGKQMNIYEWMLQFTTGSSAPVSNQPPVVNAGPDINVTLPNNTVTLAGTASDPDGSVSSYSWTQISGTSTTITNPSSASTNITGITSPGTRTFRLIVTDNLGATSSDDVVLTVYAAAGSSISDTINVNFYNQSAYLNSAWNNVQIPSGAATNITSGPMVYSDGSTSAITVALSQQSGYADNGPNYPVTMCPQIVGREVSYSTTTRYDTIAGLNNGKLYDVIFYATRGNAGQTTKFGINNNTYAAVATNSNFTTTAVFNNRAPSGGKLIFSIEALATYNYINGMTIIEHGSSDTTPVRNQPPAPRAGTDQTIILPNSSTTLDGTASTDDHNIISYQWQIISGPGGATLLSPTSAKTQVINMGQGTHGFRLTVVDDSAASRSDTVMVTVSPNPNSSLTKKQINYVFTGEYATSFVDTAGKVYATLWTGTKNQFTMYTGLLRILDGDAGQYYNIVRDSLGQVFTIGKSVSSGGQQVTAYPVDTTGAAFTGNDKAFGWFQCFFTLKGGVPYYFGGNSLKESLLLSDGTSVRDIVKPMPLNTSGKTFTKLAFMEGQGTTNGGPYPKVLALANDGTVWGYYEGSKTPTQVVGLSGVTDIASIGRACWIAVTATDILAWGPFSSYMGLPDGTKTPTSVVSQWTSIGLKMPLIKAVSGYSVVHFLDANHHLFGRGDNMEGIVGNGLQYSDWKNYTYNSNPAAFAWSWVRAQLLQNPVQIRGVFQDVFGGMSLSAYRYAIGCDGELYSWGRNKQYALGNGLWIGTGDDPYPDWGNVPAPTLVSPSTVTWLSPSMTFDPAAIQAPTANAGVAQCITVPSVQLSAAGSAQQSGTIVSYAWTQVSGAPCTIVTPGAMNTQVTGLTTGLYVFQVTTTNGFGLSSNNNVSVYVNLPSIPIPVKTQTLLLHRYQSKSF